MKDYEFIASYLADDLASSSMFDKESVKTKVKAALILLDEECTEPKTVEQMRGKIKRLHRALAKGEVRQRIMIKMMREFIGEDKMPAFFDKLNSDSETYIQSCILPEKYY